MDKRHVITIDDLFLALVMRDRAAQAALNRFLFDLLGETLSVAPKARRAAS